MNNIFEIIDKTGRKIRLTKTQFKHIICHKGMENEIEKIKETLRTPLRIDSHKEGELYDYYGYYKDRKKKAKFLQVVVKYLNGEGFVITAYFVEHI
ncbi:hypothetical protein J4408_01185 [Candidatus Pacearchaeota archaeon]|nr:hypothetical protein [Candidatus Pacearchaeota archaeon]